MKLRWIIQAFFALLLASAIFLSLYDVAELTRLYVFKQSDNTGHAIGELSRQERVNTQTPSVLAESSIEQSAVSSEQPSTEGISKSVLLHPVSSIPTQLLLNVGWHLDRSQGMRVRDHVDGVRRGVVAMLSFHGKIFFVDEADSRVVHLKSDGAIVESFDLPVRNPRQFSFTEDGSMIVWDPSVPEFFNLSAIVLGEIEQGERNQTWQKFSLPKTESSKSRARAILPTGVFYVNGGIYIEHDRGELYLVTRGQLSNPVILPGRPTSKSGLFVSAVPSSQKDGAVVVQARNSNSQLIWERKLQVYEATEHRFISFDSVLHNDFSVVTLEATKNNQRITVSAKLDHSGNVLSALELQQTTFDGFNVYNPIAVDDHNSFLHMIVNNSGVKVERHAWR